jgi:hypothetical protein
MKTTTKHFILSVLAYLIPTMVLGMLWHFVLFSEVYEGLGIYNRSEPIIPLGLGSMLIQGLVIAYLYPYYAAGKESFGRAITFSILMGVFLFSVSTLANAAKIEVTSMSTWLWIQFFFHLIQFALAGALIGLVYRSQQRN